MVTSLQSTPKSSAVDGLLAKPQAKGSQATEGASFGDILKLKEKKLDQDQGLSAPSVAAALSAMQVTPKLASAPEPVASTETPKENGQIVSSVNRAGMSVSQAQNKPDPMGARGGIGLGQSLDELNGVQLPSGDFAQVAAAALSAESSVKAQTTDAILPAVAQAAGLSVSDLGANSKATDAVTQVTGATSEVPEAPAVPNDPQAVAAENVNKPVSDVQNESQVVSTTRVASLSSNLITTGKNLDQLPVAAASPASQVSVSGAAESVKSGTMQVAQPVAAAETAKSAVEIKPSTEKKQDARPETQAAASATLAANSTTQAAETISTKTIEKGGVTPINTRAVEVVQQIMNQMNARIQQGGPASMRLQLNPKELGAIDVQMVTGAQGVSVTFFAEQASTSRLLETQMNQLRQSLNDAGIQLAGLNIGQHNQPRQEGGQNPHFAQTRQLDALMNEKAIKETQHSERIIGPLGEVDYRV